MGHSALNIDSTTTEPRRHAEQLGNPGTRSEEALSVLIAEVALLVSKQADKIARQGALLGQLQVQQETQIRRLDALISSASALCLKYETERLNQPPSSST